VVTVQPRVLCPDRDVMAEATDVIRRLQRKVQEYEQILRDLRDGNMLVSELDTVLELS